MPMCAWGRACHCNVATLCGSCSLLFQQLLAMLSACCCQLLCIVLQGLLTKATLRPSNRQKRDQQQKHHAHSHSHGHSQSCVAATPTTTCTLPSRCASGNPLNGVANSECPKRLPHNALVQISANLNRLNYIKMIFKRNPNPN